MSSAHCTASKVMLINPAHETSTSLGENTSVRRIEPCSFLRSFLLSAECLLVAQTLRRLLRHPQR